MDRQAQVLLFIPFGCLILWLLTKDETIEVVGPHELEESESFWIVKTQHVDTPTIDTIKLPHLIIQCGEVNGHMVFKTFQYDKKHYSREEVCKIIEKQLAECPRCTIK